MSTLTVMLTSLAGLALTPAAEVPSENVVIQSRVINYASEQLLTDQGVDALRQEIAQTARRVCREPGSLHTRISRESRACAALAYQQGMEQLEVQVAQARSANQQYAQNAIDSGQTTN